MKLLLIGATYLLADFAVAAISSIPVWLLWNWVMPDIFGVKAITLIQAFCLSLLSGLLFRTTSSTTY
jgi:hypothetical protein